MPVEMNIFSTVVYSRHRFSSELRYGTISLVTAADVLQFSSFVQSSICYLDLELCQSYKVNRRAASRNCPPFISFPKCFIDSEEKARKILCPRRNILDSLHLDLPKCRDWSLKNISQPKNLSDPYSIHLAKIEIKPELFKDILFEITDYACKKTNHGYKVLNWLIFNGWNLPLQAPIYIINHFVDCKPGISITDFVEECFKKLCLTYRFERKEKPGRVRNLLYLIHRSGRKREHICSSHDFLHACLFYRRLDYLRDFVKVMPELIVYKTSFLYLSSEIRYHKRNLRSILAFERKERGENSAEILNISKYFEFSSILKIIIFHENKIVERRRFLLLHFYWSFLNSLHKLPNASERLRILWDFVPDTFLCYQEIASAFGGKDLNSEDIKKFWKFYSESVGKNQLESEPRTLKHQCKIIIRKRLWNCNQWLPEGIRQIGLPPKLQSYLNLEI